MMDGMTRSRPAQQIQYVTESRQPADQIRQTDGQRFVNSITTEPIQRNNSEQSIRNNSISEQSPNIQRVYTTAPTQINSQEQNRSNQHNQVGGQDPRFMSTHDYLRQTVAQVLHEGLNILAKVNKYNI